MDRKEKLEFQTKIENYFESNQIYLLLEGLLKELVINKPADPIEYLIKRITERKGKSNSTIYWITFFIRY